MTKQAVGVVVVLSLLLFVGDVLAGFASFSPPGRAATAELTSPSPSFWGGTSSSSPFTVHSKASSARDDDEEVRHVSSSSSFTRRDLLSSAAARILGAATITTIVGRPHTARAVASTAVPTTEELARIQTGYKQIRYLLDNFEQETTTCRENGGECKRDADPVRRAMGLRSTTDPLFQIDKVFAKVKNMDIDPDKLDAFFEASEEWDSTMSMSNSMAFISQFGEYNPGGGKDEVLKYLEESRKQVMLAEKALRIIMDCLDLEVLS